MQTKVNYFDRLGQLDLARMSVDSLLEADMLNRCPVSLETGLEYCSFLDSVNIGASCGLNGTCVKATLRFIRAGQTCDLREVSLASQRQMFD